MKIPWCMPACQDQELPNPGVEILVKTKVQQLHFTGSRVLKIFFVI